MRLDSRLRCGALALALAAPRPAVAQSAVECAEAFERGQMERAALRYGVAKREFAACSRLACPPPIVKDCVGALEEVEREQPSFGFRARDEEGHEIVDVRVTIDGVLLAEHLDGSMFERDPGVYRLRFEARDFEPLETTLSLHPGERTRVVEVKLESTTPRAPASPAPQVVPLPPAAPSRPERPLSIPLASVFAAGAGVVAFGGFTYFRVQASRDYDALERCRPYCSSERVEDVRMQYVLSEIALGVSVAAFATAGLTFWLLQPKAEEPAIALEVRPSGGALTTTF